MRLVERLKKLERLRPSEPTGAREELLRRLDDMAEKLAACGDLAHNPKDSPFSNAARAIARGDNETFTSIILGARDRARAKLAGADA